MISGSESLTLVCGGTLICPTSNGVKVLRNGAILYDTTGFIVDVGDTDEIRSKIFKITPIEKEIHLKIIDAKKRVILPGLICAHHHLYSLFARGLVMKSELPTNFQEILKKLWWRLDSVLSPEDVYFSALIGLMDCLKKGITTVIDHHESQNYQLNILDEIEKAATFLGIRVCLCLGVSDRYNKGKEGLIETERYLEKLRSYDSKLVIGMVGLHASFTVKDETIEKAKKLTEKYNTGIHIHCAEDLLDQEDSLKNYGLRVVKRLNKFGLLGKKTILAHCVHVDDEEIKIIRDTETNIVLNPESNMNNAVGCAPVLNFFKSGINVGLGTDGMSSDMLSQARCLFLIQRHVNSNPCVGFNEAIKALLYGNPTISQELFGIKIGYFEKGAPADIIVFNYIPPTEVNEENWAGHLLFGMIYSPVDTVIVQGKTLIREGLLQNVSEGLICEKSREIGKKVWEKFWTK